MKTVFYFVCAIIVSMLLFSISYAGQVTLAWDANSESNLAGYKLYYGNTKDGPYSGTDCDEGTSPITYKISDLGNASSPQITVNGFTEDKTVYFVLTAFDTDGQESDYSNEVSTTVNANPPVAPGNLQIIQK